MARVWCVDFGFGTVVQDNGQFLLICWDCEPLFPATVNRKEVIPAEWMR